MTGLSPGGHRICGLSPPSVYNSQTVQKYTLTVSLASAVVAGALASLLASACGSSNGNSDFNPGGGAADATADGSGRGDEREPDRQRRRRLGLRDWRRHGPVERAHRAGQRVASRCRRADRDAGLQGHGDRRRGGDPRSTSRATSSSGCPTTTWSATSRANGGPLFTTRLPARSTDPPQQGGTLTVEAEALNPGNVTVTATTQPHGAARRAHRLPRRGARRRRDRRGPARRTPAALFGGPADPTRAPVLEYPNDGTMLPPNLHVLDVHWMPGSASNTSTRSRSRARPPSITYYTALRHPRTACWSRGRAASSSTRPATAISRSRTRARATSPSRSRGPTRPARASARRRRSTSSSRSSPSTAASTTGTSPTRRSCASTSAARADVGPGLPAARRVRHRTARASAATRCRRDGTKMAASAGGQGNGLLEYVNDIATHRRRRSRQTDDSAEPHPVRLVQTPRRPVRRGLRRRALRTLAHAEQPLLPRRQHRRHHPPGERRSRSRSSPTTRRGRPTGR